MDWRRPFKRVHIPYSLAFACLAFSTLQAAEGVGPLEDPAPLSRDYLIAKGRMDTWGRTVQPKPGSQQTFWVRVPSDTQGHMFQYALKTETLLRTGKHCYLYLGEGVSLSDSALDFLKSNYDSIIYPICQRYFGHEWNPGIDGDSLVTILIEPALTDPSHHDSPRTEFYFSPYDEMPDSLAQRYGHRSNEREMFYIRPSGNPIRIAALMAHCQEHLVHWYQNPPGEIWLNEACAMYAMDLCGFGSQISELDSFRANSGGVLNSWPSGIIDFPKTLSEPIDAQRGKGYALIAYLMDKYPGTNPQDPLVYHLVGRRDHGLGSIGPGIGNIEFSLREVGYPWTYFRDIFPPWTVANFLNDTTLGAPPKIYGYRKPLGGQLHFVAHPTYGPPNWFNTLPDSVQLTLPLYGQACIYVPAGKGDRRVEFAQDIYNYTVEGQPYSAFIYQVYLVTTTTDSFLAGTDSLSPFPPDSSMLLSSNSATKGVKFILSLPYKTGRGEIPASYVFAYAPLSPAESSTVSKAVYVFPNPFNPDKEKVHFRYVITAPGKVDIRIYDAGGNQVAVVADEEWQSTPAIYTSRTWDGRNYRGIPVANGIYFGRVRIGNRTTGVKIAVMR